MLGFRKVCGEGVGGRGGAGVVRQLNLGAERMKDKCRVTRAD